MNREDIIRMAWEAGMGDYLWLSPKVDGYAEEVSSLERFAALVEQHVLADKRKRQEHQHHWEMSLDGGTYVCECGAWK